MVQDLQNEQDDFTRVRVLDRPEEPAGENPLRELDALIRERNIARLVDEMTLARMAQRVVQEYKIDEASRKDWIEAYDKAQDLVKFTVGQKSSPWAGASNVLYPIISESAIQFSSRAYPAIVSGDSVVKGKVIGKDEDGAKAGRAMRIGEHMSYQVLEEMEDWEDDMDWLLLVISITGCEFKKTWFNPATGKNVSEWITSKDVVVNNSVKSLEKALRITQVYELYPYEIAERVRAKKFLKFEYGRGQGGEQADEDAPHTFYEQHRRWDLDDDGYEEPYIITVHKETGKVCRITAGFDSEGIYKDEDGTVTCIEPVQYFTKFGFLKSFNGTFYDVGYGHLLLHPSHVINTLINQLVDAGTNANTGGGFVSAGLGFGSGRSGGEITFAPGEYKMVTSQVDDLRKAFVPRPVANPSQVTFTLLELLITSSEKFANVTDVLTGSLPPANTPATTTMAMVEQGLKVFSAIYKRIFRALKKEFKKIARLNRLYLDDDVYFNVLDTPKAVRRADYEDKDCDVVPVSDPQNVADSMRLLQAEALMKLIGQGLDDRRIKLRYLEALHVQDVEELIPDEDAANQPSTEMKIKLAEIENDKARLALDTEKFRADADKTRAEVERINAETEKTKAETEKVLREIEEIGKTPPEAGSEAMLSRIKALEAENYRLKQGA